MSVGHHSHQPGPSANSQTFCTNIMSHLLPVTALPRVSYPSYSATIISPVESEESTSDNYLQFLTVINSQRCRLLDNKRLISQLAMLERRPSKTGARDLVVHPAGAHDDIATSTAGLVTLVATKKPAMVISDRLLARAGMPLPQVGDSSSPLMASWTRDDRHQQIYQSPPGGSWSDMYDRMKGN